MKNIDVSPNIKHFRKFIYFLKIFYLLAYVFILIIIFVLQFQIKKNAKNINLYFSFYKNIYLNLSEYLRLLEKNIRDFITRYIVTIPVKVAENGLIEVDYYYVIMLLDGFIIRIALCTVRSKYNMLFYNEKQRKDLKKVAKIKL
jgi:hypothetical protein